MIPQLKTFPLHLCFFFSQILSKLEGISIPKREYPIDLQFEGPWHNIQ